jgi:hypothetical protein
VLPVQLLRQPLQEQEADSRISQHKNHLKKVGEKSHVEIAIVGLPNAHGDFIYRLPLTVVMKNSDELVSLS